MSDRRIELLFERFRRQGDVEALGQVFDATAPALRRVARHLTRDAAEAEDLVQATFLAAIEKRATFDEAREVSPWLTGILLKQASLARRARARAVDPERLEGRSSVDPLDAAAGRELSEALTVALARLSQADRDVLIPLLLDGRRAVEIARELGRRPDTVHMRIHRGLARLRELLPAGLASIAITRASEARGLASVRVHVLRRAQSGLGGASVVAAGAGAAGVVMSMKQVAVAIVLVSMLGIGGYVVAMRADAGGAMQAASNERALVLAPVAEVQPPATDANSRAAVPEGGLATTGPTAVESMLVLEVTRADRESASGALVAIVDADGKVAGGRTDDSGRCAFAAGSGSGRVYIRDEGAFPERFVVDLAAGRRALELRRGSELAGRLVMTGLEPLPRFELRLTTDSTPEGLADASSDVFHALDMIEYTSPSLVARTTPASDGSFRFRVPDASWTGTLKLPLELVFVDTSKPTRSSERVLERALLGYEATITYRPRIVGRLVDSVTRRPLGRTEFDCALHWSDGNDMLTGGRTGEDGRFTIALDYRTDVTGFGIGSVRTRDGRVASVPTTPTWTGPCEPFQAGDVACVFPPSRELAFRAVDAEGRPIAGARAHVRGLDVVAADERGVGTFAAVPLDATELRVAAPGRAIASVGLTAGTTSPLDVVLAPTNKLTIELPPEAWGRDDLYVLLVSRALLFGGTTRMYDTNLRGGMVGSCFSADGDAGTREGSVRLGFGAEGRIEVEGVATGVPFRVRLEGWSFRGAQPGRKVEMAVEPLGATEQRLVRLALNPGAGGSLRTLRGRVIDESGRPIHGASVGTRIGDDSTGTTSEFDGSFRLDLTDVDATDVEITKRGFLPFRERAWDLATDRALEATLHRGRDLRIELVDAEGRPVSGARLSADIAGFGAPWKIENDVAGVHVLCDVPAGRANVEIELAGRTYARSHDGASEFARFVLPAHGRVELSWRIGEPSESRRSFQIALRPLDPGVTPQVEWTPGTEPEEKHVFEAVLPGEYTVGLEVGTPPAGNADTVFVPLREPTRITVCGGETLRIEL